jgi:hypothetical protein
MADGFLSTLGRRAHAARDTAEDYGSRAAETVRERGGDARGELRRLWSQLEDVVERSVVPAAHDATRRAGSYATHGRDIAYDVADQLRSATRARPLVAIGIAVVATWVVASLLSSGRRR